MLVQCPHCFAGPIAVEPDEFEFLCPVCTFRVRRLRQLPPRVRSRTSPAHLPFDRIGPFQILDALEYTPLGVRYKGFRVGESPEERQYLSIFVLSGLVSTDESLRARLDERCRLARRLSDTGFVRVVESGAENEMWYVATLSSSGSGLDDYLMNPAVTNEARLALVTTLVRSVTHAHQLGLVFGLMTPLSLFVEPNGLPKIHDFGLTHELLSDRRAAETLPVGAFTAAMAYLAPELRDFQQPPTSASDVYSLGVLLATVFCGRPISGMLRSLSQLQPAAPTALDPIVRRATAPEPDQRYAHAETLLSDLMQLDLDAPSQRIETRRSRAPQPEPSPALEIERERPLRPRPPIDWRIAVTLIALGALAFLLYRWITDRATPQTHIAPTADTNERRDVSEPNPDERTPTEDATTPTSTGLTSDAKLPPLLFPRLVPLSKELFTPTPKHKTKRRRRKRKHKTGNDGKTKKPGGTTPPPGSETKPKTRRDGTIAKTPPLATKKKPGRTPTKTSSPTPTKKPGPTMRKKPGSVRSD